MGVYNATIITAAGQNLIAEAIAGGDAVNFSSLKTSTHVYPAGTSLQNLTALDDVKQSVSPTSVDVYNNNIVQVSARVPNTGIATAYLINTIGLFGQVTGGTETLIAVLTAETPDEVPVFDPESPAAFIFNVQMTIQNADTVTFEVNDSGTATVADLNRVAQTFSGATASAAGTVGRVPAPVAGADGKFLRGDATWAAPADMVENFTSSDVADGSATDWTSVIELDSGETNASIFAKMSQMFKNIRYLYKMLGQTDISNIGSGTVTNALQALNGAKLKNGTIPAYEGSAPTAKDLIDAADPNVLYQWSQSSSTSYNPTGVSGYWSYVLIKPFGSGAEGRYGIFCAFNAGVGYSFDYTSNTWRDINADQNTYTQLTTFRNGWSANGTCFTQKEGELTHIHLAVRNGTKTDGTDVLAGLNNTADFIGPLVNREAGTCGYWYIQNATKTLKIYGVTSNNILLDAYYK